MPKFLYCTYFYELYVFRKKKIGLSEVSSSNWKFIVFFFEIDESIRSIIKSCLDFLFVDFCFILCVY